jgi:hypothetical protein
MPSGVVWPALASPEKRLELAVFAEANEFDFGILSALLVN